MPGNHGTLYDSHQGVVMLFGIAHGEPLAIPTRRRSPRSATPRRSAARTDALARHDAGRPALLGAGTQARSHLAAMGNVRRLRRVACGAHAAHASTSHARTRARRGASRSRWRAGPGRRAQTPTWSAPRRAREPILEGVARARHHVNASARSSRPAASSTPRRPPARFFTDCRESCLNESGTSGTPAPRARSPTFTCSANGRRVPRKSPGGCRADDITVYESLGIGSRTSRRRTTSTRARSTPAAETWLEWGGPPGSRMTARGPARAPSATREAGSSPRAASRASRCARRCSASAGAVEPETWLKLETLQPIGSFRSAAPASAMGRSADELARASTRERRQHGQGVVELMTLARRSGRGLRDLPMAFALGARCRSHLKRKGKAMTDHKIGTAQSGRPRRDRTGQARGGARGQNAEISAGAWSCPGFGR